MPDLINEEKTLTETIKLNPENWLAYRARADFYKTKGKYRLAIDDYNEAIKKNHDRPDPWNFANRGLTKVKLDLLPEAISDLTEAIKLYPEKGGYNHYRGDIYFKQGEYEKAILDYDEAIIKNGPNDSGSLTNRAIAKTELGLYSEAILDLTKAIELEASEAKELGREEHGFHYHARGKAYHGLEEYEKAIQDFNKAVELDPRNVDYLRDLGIAQAKLKSIDYAMKTYDQMVDLSTKVSGATGASIDELGREIEEKITSEENNKIYINKKLINAIRKKDFKGIEKAIEEGANPNQYDENGLTAIHHAAKVGYKEGVEYFFEQKYIEKHAVTEKDHDTPLHLAAEHGHKHLVIWLIEQGLDVHSKNKNGYTPADVAEKGGYKGIAKYIKEENEVIMGWSRFLWRNRNFISGGVTTLATLIGGLFLRGGFRPQPHRAAAVPGGVHAGEVSLDAHPLRDLYEERWLKSQPPKNITSAVSSEPLLTLDSKPSAIRIADRSQEAPKTPLSQSNISSSLSPSLSANDYLGVVVPYLAHYTRKYSPFTLPWNRKNNLSDQDRQKLNEALNKHNHLGKNFLEQQKSRAASRGFLSDKVSFVEKGLRTLKPTIDGLLKKGKASSSQLSEVQSKLERIEEVMKQLSANNKNLRHFEVRKKRLAKRSQRTGKQASTVLHYNVTENRLTQEVVYDHPPLLMPAESGSLKMKRETESAGLYRLSHAQRFWTQPVSSPTAQAIQDKAGAKLPMISAPNVTRR